MEKCKKIINRAAMKEFVKGLGFSSAKQLDEALETKLKDLIVMAVTRAKNNQRRTVLIKDV